MSSQDKLLSNGYFQSKNDRTCFRRAVSSHQPDSPGKTSCPDTNRVWHQAPGSYEMSCGSFSMVSQRTVISTSTHTLNKCIFQIPLISGCYSLKNVLRLVSVRLSTVYPRRGSMVMASHFALLVKCRLPNPPAYFSSAGNQQIPKGRKELKIWQGLNAESFTPHFW